MVGVARSDPGYGCGAGGIPVRELQEAAAEVCARTTTLRGVQVVGPHDLLLRMIDFEATAELAEAAAPELAVVGSDGSE
jgi:hypothetical protein